MKHVPFQSIYREEFEVVEQKLGNVSLYPHTDQLPVIHRALNLEFLGALPGYISRIDKRADDFHKILLYNAALYYSTISNVARTDRLRLIDLPDPDLVMRLTVVQHIIETEPLGRVHRFRFYGPNGFFPEIRMSGKRIAFADHVLQRYSKRVPNRVGEDLTLLLCTFFGGTVVSLPVGHGRAFVFSLEESMLAFTYKETADEYFITTCLTPNEINSLEREAVPQVHTLHFGETFTEPPVRTWNPAESVAEIYDRWQRKVPFVLKPVPPMSDRMKKWMNDWRWVAQHIKELNMLENHSVHSKIFFTDHIYGPGVTLRKLRLPLPDNKVLQDKITGPRFAWGDVFAQSKDPAALPPQAG